MRGCCAFNRFGGNDSIFVSSASRKPKIDVRSRLERPF